MTSNQSLAGSHPLQIEKTIHNTVICKKKKKKADASDHASDQTEYTWIYHKRPVACRVAHLQDTKDNITKRTIDMTSDQTKSTYNKE